MTGKTASETYAVIASPDPASPSFIWTATIHRKGFKRTETLHAYSEESLIDHCRARGINVFRSANADERPETPPTRP